VAHSKVTAVLLLPDILSNKNICLGNSTGGVLSALSPTKYFFSVVLLVILLPSKESKSDTLFLNILEIFAKLILGLALVPLGQL